MADSTPLGNLDVVISADWSDLQSEINDAVAASQTAADAIEAAFNGIDTSEAVASIGFLGGAAQAAGDSLSTFGQAAQDSTSGIASLNDATAPLAGSLNDAGDAANSAGGSLGGFGDDASDAAASASEAEGGVRGLAEQFAALGEALAVTEGLKEFGEEALTAYGTVQSVTIGLTQLTGSAEQADEIITQIKELAATEPFAFPEIAPTIQKMVALGVSAGQIPGVMQAVADAAAATGNQFSQVANSFDRMTLSGTVSARSLVQLGVNTTDLGQVMGVTADQVKAAFLAMDQTDRITALEAALAKFAGSAEAQAEGIAGQWQIFQNQFEEVMVGVGEAIAPVVSGILDFGKEVLTVTQGAIEAFNELPGPVKDVVVAVGLLVAATVPLAGLISATGFAIIGFQTAVTTGKAILQSLSVTSSQVAVTQGVLGAAVTSTAVKEDAAAVSTGALATAEKGLGIASGEAAIGVEATSAAATEGAVGAEALGGGLLAAGAATGVLEVAAVALGVALLGWGVYEAATSSTDLGNSVSDTAAAVTSQGVPAVNALGEAATSFSTDVNTKAVPAANDLVTAIGKIPNVTTTTTTAFDAAGKTVTTVTTGFNSFGQQVTQTSKVLQDGVSDVDQFGVGLTNTAGQMAEAAVKALALKGGMGDVNLSTKTYTDSEGNLLTVTGQLTPAIQTMATAFTNLFAAMGKGAAAQAQYAITGSTGVATTEAVDAAIQHLTASVTASANATTVNQAVLAKLQAQLADLVPGTADYATQLQMIALQMKAMGTATDTASTSGKGFKDTIDGVTQAMEQAQEKAQSSISVFQDLATAHSGDADAVGLLAASYTKAESAAKAAGIAFASAAGEAAKQQIAFDQASASTQAMQDALGGLIIQYYAAVAAGDDTTSIQQQIALSYKAVEAEVAKTGGTYENAAAQLIALNVAGNNAQSALTGQAAVWTQLASTTNKTADQQAQMAAVFKTVQTDAAAVGLSVTAVGNSLIYSLAPGIKMNDTVKALLDTLNAAAIASGNFVIKNGVLVPTLSAVANAASAANAGTGGMNATINAAGVIISGLGTAATTAAPQVAAVGTAAQNTGAQAQNAGTQIINLNKNMDGIYETVFTGAPVVTQYGNAIKGVGTAAQGAGTQIINLNTNMDGIYETVFTGAPVVTQYGAALTSAGKSAQGAAPNITTVGTAVTGVSAIINGVKFANWETGFSQTGGAATTAATQITSYGTASTDVGNILANVPMKADLAATAFTDTATAAAALPAKFTLVDGAISVMGNSLGEGNQDLVTFQQKAQNANGSISNITVSVTGLEDPLNVMGSAAQQAATHVQTMGQYATTCGDECGDLTDEVEDFTNAAPAADSAADNIATGFNTMATAAQNATTQVNSLASALEDAGSVGDGMAAGATGATSSVSKEGAQASAISEMYAANVPAGAVMNVGNPYDPNTPEEESELNFLTADGGVDLDAPITATSSAEQAGLEAQGFTDVTLATQANTTATTANTTATSSNSTALGTGTTAVTANTGSINLATGAYTANTSAVNAMSPAFTGLVQGIGSATSVVGQIVLSLQTYMPVIAGVTDTTTLASQAIQANAAAFAQSTNATGESTQAQIEAMYEAEGFSQNMATAGAEAVLGLQNTTDATNSLFPVLHAFGQAADNLSAGLTGSSGLNSAVGDTTDALTGSSGLVSGLNSTVSVLSGSSGLNKAVGDINTGLSGPSGLAGVFGSLTDAANQAASALHAVGTSGNLSGETVTTSTGANPLPTGPSGLPTSPMPTTPLPAGEQYSWDNATQSWGIMDTAGEAIGGPNPNTSTSINETSTDQSGTALLANLQGEVANLNAAGFQASLTDLGSGVYTLSQNVSGAPDSVTGSLSQLSTAAANTGPALATTGAAAFTTGSSLYYLNGSLTTTAQNVQLASDGIDALGNTVIQASAIIGGQVQSLVTNSADPNASAEVAALSLGLSTEDPVQAAATAAAQASTLAAEATNQQTVAASGLTGAMGELYLSLLNLQATSQSLSTYQQQELAAFQAGNSGTLIAANDPSLLATGPLLTAIQQMNAALTAPDTGNKLSALDPNNPNNILTPVSQPITLTPVFNFGTVVGSNAAQQLVNMVMPQMVAQLRQAGVKI